MADKTPNSTIKIEKTIRNAPVSEDDLDEVIAPPKKRKRAASSEVVTEEEVDQFAEMLNDHTVKIHVDRVSPKEWKGKAISGMIEEYVPPTTIEEVETDIRNRFGGGRYRVRTMKNGKFLGARGISVYGDPKFPAGEMEDEDDDFEPNFGPPMSPFMRPGGQFPVAGDDETSDLRKQIEREKLRKVLKDVKGEDTRAPKVDAEKIRRETEAKIHSDYELRGAIKDLRTDMDTRFTDMVAGLRETLTPKEPSVKEDMKVMELENRIERIKGEVSNEIKGLNSDIKSMFSEFKREEPKQDTTPQLLQAIIGGFSQMANSGEGRMQAMMEAERIKSEALLNSVREMNNANAKVSEAQSDRMLTVFQNMNQGADMNGIAKTVGAVRDIAESMGMGSGSGGGSEGEPQDAVSRIISLVEKAMPSIMAAAKQKEQQQGSPALDRGELARIIQQQAQEAAHSVKSSGLLGQQPPLTQVRAPQTQQPQGATPPAQVDPVNGPQAWQTPDTLQTPVQEPYIPVSEPVAEPVAAPVAEPTTEATPAPNPASAENVDPIQREYYMRVNASLEKLVREVQIRPRNTEWNEYAFDTLPEPVLDKLMVATDAEGVFHAVQEYAHPEFIEYLKKIFEADKRATDWFVEGLNEMKEWYANGDHERSDEVVTVPEIEVETPIPTPIPSVEEPLVSPVVEEPVVELTEEDVTPVVTEVEESEEMANDSSNG